MLNQAPNEPAQNIFAGIEQPKLTHPPEVCEPAEPADPEAGALRYFAKQRHMDRVIKCRHCGEDYMHHQDIDIYDRGEDDRTGMHVNLHRTQSEGYGWHDEHPKSNNLVVDGNMKDNPSMRRTGLTIDFWCENCGNITRMNIVQHKGHSFMHIEAIE